MTMADNKKFNKKVIKNPEVYQRYDNYDAIEVSYTDAIPSDYDGQMGCRLVFWINIVLNNLRYWTLMILLLEKLKRNLTA